MCGGRDAIAGEPIRRKGLPGRPGPAAGAGVARPPRPARGGAVLAVLDAVGPAGAAAPESAFRGRGACAREGWREWLSRRMPGRRQRRCANVRILPSPRRRK